MVRKALSSTKKTIMDFKRLMSVLKKMKSNTLVGYTKKHPIYTDLCEENPPKGFVFYIRSTQPLLAKIDKYIWSKIKILHLDAASTLDPDNKASIVIECEGYPRKEFLNNPYIKQVFVESKWAAQETINHPKVKLLYPSVSLPTKNSIKRDLKSEYITITAVGYGGMVKGFDVVFKIYQTLKKDYKIKLILAGSFGHNYTYYPEISQSAYNNADFKNIEKILKADPLVKFGPIKRKKLLKKIFPKTDIYLHLSRLETFGYSILEAMSHGIPVVATNLHAIPEMVTHNENGFLVNDFKDDINSKEWFNKSYEESLKAIKFLIEDPQQRLKMGENGFNKVKTNFNIENKKTIVSSVYNSILK